MRAKALPLVARGVRSVLNFAAPALVIGLLLTSRSYGIIYPPGQAGVLERSVDSILARERIDILRQSQLVQTQFAIGNVLTVLLQRLQTATNPREIAFLDQQIKMKAVQYQSFQRSINQQAQVLAKDLFFYTPLKDMQLRQLGTLPRPANQIAMFIQAASLREQTYTAAIKLFLAAHPVTPVTPF